MDAGAEFGAYVQPFTCDLDGAIYARTAADTTKNKQSIPYNKPTNYVYYSDATNSHPVKPVYSMPSYVKNSINNSQPAMSITPNPSGGLFTLSLNENTASEIFIYNSLGQVVYKSTPLNIGSYSTGSTNQPINQLPIDLSAQPKGIYFVKLVLSGAEGAADKVYTEKVILQ